MTVDAAVLAPLTARCCLSHFWLRRPGTHPSHIAEPLSVGRIVEHLNGGYAVGVCPIHPGASTTECAVLDLDSHKGEVSWREMQMQAQGISEALAETGLHAIPFRSSGGQGIHLYLLWREPQDAYSVRQALLIALAKCGLADGVGGVAKNEVEIFPKQDSVPADGAGSMFILPLHGQSVALAPVTLDEPALICWRASDPVPQRERPITERRQISTTADVSLLKSALDAIPNSGNQELSYDEWRNVVFAIHSGTAGSDDGLALAHGFSARSSKYDPAFLDQRVWPYIRDRDGPSITARTIFAMASRHGWTDPTLADAFPVTPPASDVTVASQPTTPLSAGGNPFRCISAAEFAAPREEDWLVEGVLEQGAIAMIYGDSTAGKTFWALDLGACIAQGIEWNGHDVTKGRVAYVAAEDTNGVRKRARAYAEKHKISLDDLDMVFIENAPDFSKTEDIQNVIRSLDDANREKGKARISVVFIDTFATVTPGANENSGEDMGKALYHCQQIHRTTGALVILIHHSGKDSTKGARGWSGIRAAVNTEIEITRVNDDRSAQVTKSKNGADGTHFGFKLEIVPMGHDKKGRPVTSCAIVHTGSSKPLAKRKEPKTSIYGDAFRNALMKLLGDTTGPERTLSRVIDLAMKSFEGDNDPRLRDLIRNQAYVMIHRGEFTKDDGDVIDFPVAGGELV